MRFFGDEYIEHEAPPLFDFSVVSCSEGCTVFEIPYSAVKECLNGEPLSSVFLKNEHTKELFKRVNRCEKIEDLSGFEFNKNLGLGGFGVVFRVSDQSGTDYALKVIDRKSLTSRSSIKMIKHEKEVLEMVQFPFLVQLHSTCKDEGNYYLLMDYVHGITFDNVLYELDILEKK